MNWLAHVWLSPDDPRQRLGNLLTDLLRPADLALLPAGYGPGIALHRFIDEFTDAHPATRRTAERFWGTHRRAAGILTDVFFDHVLAAEWPQFEARGLAAFNAEFYDEIRAHLGEIPASIHPVLQRLIAEDWFGSYATLAGIEGILFRLEFRLRNRLELRSALAHFPAHAAAIGADFRELLAGLRAAGVAAAR